MGDPVQPSVQDFNARLQASTQNLDPDLVRTLERCTPERPCVPSTMPSAATSRA